MKLQIVQLGKMEEVQEVQVRVDEEIDEEDAVLEVPEMQTRTVQMPKT